MRVYFNKPVFTYFDNDPPVGDPEPKDPEVFTQDDVTKLIDEEKTKFNTERTKMVTQLEEIQKTAALNGEQKTELEEQVTALREASMTSEERAKAALNRKEQDFQERMLNLETERNEWQGKYTKTRINNALLSAANSNELKPYHSDDICNALGPDTYLKEIVDDLGKKTGNYDVRIKFTDINEDGKTETIDMEPTQAVSKMSKMPRWAHLFKSGKKSGSEGSASASGTEIDLAKLAETDPKKFLELTSENPDLLN